MRDDANLPPTHVLMPQPQQACIADASPHVTTAAHRRQHDAVPGAADGIAAEMTHVGIQRLRAGDAQKHSAEHQEPRPAAVRQELDAMARVDGLQHPRIAHDAVDSENCNDDEPEQHDGPERASDTLGTESLRGDGSRCGQTGRSNPGDNIRLPGRRPGNPADG